MNKQYTPTPEQIQKAKHIAKHWTGGSLMTSPVSNMGLGPGSWLSSAAELRDERLHRFPILPEAVKVFQQLASTREWTVSGPVRAAQKVVEALNNTICINPSTGYTSYGLEDFNRRRALDWVAVGRTSFTYNQRKQVLEYLDPTRLQYLQPKSQTYEQIFTQVLDNQYTWRYCNARDLRWRDVVVNEPFPIGSNSFIAPIASVLPAATLAWLMREHDTAAIDGRKIREILFVSNMQLSDAIENAINIQIALWSGATPEEVGIPVVEINNPSGAPIQDQIGRLGISEIPDSFNRGEFIFQYVNEIAASLGLALRHFWNDEKTTNRALEIVQEQRQQQKGPSSFVRTEQRLINNSKFLSEIAGTTRTIRFEYVEESDTASLKDRAEVLERNARALQSIAQIFGAQLSGEAYLSWMQSIGALPHELQLIQDKAPTTGTVAEQPAINEADEGTIGGDPKPIGAAGEGNAGVGTGSPADNFSKSESELKYDECRIDQNGKLLEVRRKIFTVAKAIEEELIREQEETEKYVNGIDALAEMDHMNQIAFRELYIYNTKGYEKWVSSLPLPKQLQVGVVAEKVMGLSSLSDDEQTLINEILLGVES